MVAESVSALNLSLAVSRPSTSILEVPLLFWICSWFLASGFFIPIPTLPCDGRTFDFPETDKL